MSKLIVANWKMNPLTEKAAVSLARAEDLRGLVIAPPFLFLESVGRSLKKASLGAQDLAWNDAKRGPFTGEISAKMLKGAGVKYVIIGHSERRMLGETDVIVNNKLKVALKAGLKVILCVGEPWGIRKKGISAVQNFVKNQLVKDLKGINPKFYILNSKLFIAYEPVWAISNISGNRSDKPEDAVEMIKFIKKTISPNSKVLYGGSVNAKNAKSFLSQKEIDGALVGGASLRAVGFGKIVKATF